MKHSTTTDKVFILIAVLFILLGALILTAAKAEAFINPLDFKGTEQEKAQVVQHIKADVQVRYARFVKGDPSMARLMEEDELNSFKALTMVEDRELLKDVMAKYARVGFDSYTMILTLYQDNLKSKKQSLSW